MGGICSRTSTVVISHSQNLTHRDGFFINGYGLINEAHELPKNLDNNLTQFPVSESTDKQQENLFTFPEIKMVQHGMDPIDIHDGIPTMSKALSYKSRSTKSKQAGARVSEVSSLLGKAGTVGLGKAVEVLDTLGSSMINLNLNSGFVSGVTTKGNKISILSFEVANTIVKGANLMQSLSKENIKHLKEVVLPSDGVQYLISKDMEELLQIAEADKREELKVFSREVIRFGNRSKDPQWHNLDRYFEKLGSELTSYKQLKEEAETMMQQLMSLVQYTAELYHEWNTLDKFEQDYRRKLHEEDDSNAAQRDCLEILRAELKNQRKHFRGLQKKSFWCKNLEEVIEKLVDIVHFLHLEIHDAFGSPDDALKSSNNYQKLGSAGLALHYANIITQIDTLVTQSGSVPSNIRDTLYHGLPPRIKSALRPKLQSSQNVLTVSQIKFEMEKTLRWLVPIATNTAKAHHGFGWVGEWANMGSDMNCKFAGQCDLTWVETLHHASKDKTEAYILELIVLLHHLVSQSRTGNTKFGIKSPNYSANKKTIQLSPNKPNCSESPTFTVEDRARLIAVCNRKHVAGISRSQELYTVTTRIKEHRRLSKSISHTPISETKNGSFSLRQPCSFPVINFDIDRIRPSLNVIDRVDTIPS